MDNNILFNIGSNKVSLETVRGYFREYFLKIISEKVIRGESVDGWAKQAMDMVDLSLDNLEQTFKRDPNDTEDKNKIAR